jgi:hypothetical protein
MLVARSLRKSHRSPREEKLRCKLAKKIFSREAMKGTFEGDFAQICAGDNEAVRTTA